jgi:dipeptidyl aminopeptidase/acylaminoacyl peptidase
VQRPFFFSFPQLFRPATAALIAAGLLVGPSLRPAAAQSAPVGSQPRAVLDTEGYVEPDAVIRDAVLAPRWRNVTVSNLDPTGRYFVHAVSDGPPPLERFARPHLNLGALQIDPQANRSRRLTTRSELGYQLVSTETGSRIDVEVPAGARVSGAVWSPDGSQLAFLAHTDEGTWLHVADTRDGASRRVMREPLLAVHVTEPVWTRDGRELAVVLAPSNRSPMPVEGAVPASPMVRQTTDVENQLRTYFDLLESPHEKELVRWFSTGQLALVDVASGTPTRVGAERMITAIDPAPDGNHVRVEFLTGELSYIVPTMSSATREELWDRSGAVLAVLTETPAREGADDDDADADGDGDPQRRALKWHPTEPGLLYLQMDAENDEAANGAADGDASSAGAGDEPDADEQRSRPMDRLYHWAPPFTEGSAVELYATSQRMRSVDVDASGGTLFITRGQLSWSGDGSQTLHAVRLDAPDEEHLISRRSGDDWADDPGVPMMVAGGRGLEVVRMTDDGSSVYLSGTDWPDDPSAEAPRPFIDRRDIETGATERIFESAADRFEQVAGVASDDLSALLLHVESRTEVPQVVRLDRATGERTTLTDNVDYTPDLTRAHQVRFMVTRPDGFASQVAVTLPPGWSEGDAPPPALFWFYPREYTSQEQYESRTVARFNRNEFPELRTRSMEIMALNGYAVVTPDLPIVGDPGQMNDNYVQDLRNTLSAVIDSLSARGLVDRARLGIGGHSYGAFGTVNAMVNTPFFKAGIAGDGNYNRSLTPAGFQSERRQLWEAEQIYIEMSPFFTADRLTGSLLMYHGMDDHNVGTHPDHSRRLFHALNVLGKDAALYMYPFEDHGPATRETLLDLWARWTAWLDLHVKGEPSRAPVS